MITDRNHLTNWKEVLIFRQWIRIDELKRVTIQGVSRQIVFPQQKCVTRSLTLFYCLYIA